MIDVRIYCIFNRTLIYNSDWLNCRYADRPNSFWSGYFTSRAAQKGFERLASGVLQAWRSFNLNFNIFST